MGTATLCLRQIALQRQINDDQLQSMMLKSRLNRYTRFSNMIASGVNLSPAALASVGGELFGDALDCMSYAQEEAGARADEQLEIYLNAFENLTEEQYYTSGLASQAAIYTDEDGNPVTEQAWEKFYEQALKEYVEQVIMPELNELEKELQDEQAALETQIMQEEQELEAVKQAKEQAIQREQIKLG